MARNDAFMNCCGQEFCNNTRHGATDQTGPPVSAMPMASDTINWGAIVIAWDG